MPALHTVPCTLHIWWQTYSKLPIISENLYSNFRAKFRVRIKFNLKNIFNDLYLCYPKNFCISDLFWAKYCNIKKWLSDQLRLIVHNTFFNLLVNVVLLVLRAIFLYFCPWGGEEEFIAHLCWSDYISHSVDCCFSGL